jgi:hypothetical protein
LQYSFLCRKNPLPIPIEKLFKARTQRAKVQRMFYIRRYQKTLKISDKLDTIASPFPVAGFCWTNDSIDLQ